MTEKFKCFGEFRDDYTGCSPIEYEYDDCTKCPQREQCECVVDMKCGREAKGPRSIFIIEEYDMLKDRWVFRINHDTSYEISTKPNDLQVRMTELQNDNPKCMYRIQQYVTTPPDKSGGVVT